MEPFVFIGGDNAPSPQAMGIGLLASPPPPIAGDIAINGIDADFVSYNNRHVYAININGQHTWTSPFVERHPRECTFQTTYEEFTVTLVGYDPGDPVTIVGATGTGVESPNQITFTGIQIGESPVRITFNETRTDMHLFFDSLKPAIRELSFDATNFISLDYMLKDQVNLGKADIYNANIVTTMSQLFQGCNEMTDVMIADTGALTDVSAMFGNCTNLKNLHLEGFNSIPVTQAQYMFHGCTSLLQIGNFELPNVEDMSYVFKGCVNLQLVGSLGSGPSLTTVNNMFEGCSSLTCVQQIDTILATNTTDMFLGCTALTSPGAANQTEILNQAIWFDDTCSDNGIIRGSILLTGSGVNTWIGPDHVKYVSVCQGGAGAGGEDGFGSTDGGTAGAIDTYNAKIVENGSYNYTLGVGGGRGSAGGVTIMFGVTSSGGTSHNYRGDGGIRTTCGGTFVDGQETGSVFGRSYGGQAGAHGNGGNGDTYPSVGHTGGGGENRTGGDGAIKISWG